MKHCDRDYCEDAWHADGGPNSHPPWIRGITGKDPRLLIHRAEYRRWRQPRLGQRSGMTPEREALASRRKGWRRHHLLMRPLLYGPGRPGVFGARKRADLPPGYLRRVAERATALGGFLLAGSFACAYLVGGLSTGIWVCATGAVIIAVGVAYTLLSYRRLPP